MTDGTLKLSKLQQRLQTAIEEKRFYEAHQMYKTLYFRCSMRRNYAEALKYLYSGADIFLSNQQWVSGTDLACLILEVYTKSKMDLTEVQLNKICELVMKMPAGEERTTFINKTTTLLNSHKKLLCGFNEQLGRLFWQEGSLNEARLRIMLSLNGYAAGSFLIALHQRYGLRSEIDLFITQAVLQFLCMRQSSVAILTFYTYTRGHPRLEPGPPFTRFPLLNFIWFLMLAIEKKCSFSVFAVLREKYSSQINRDSTYLTYLDKIAELYFGVAPPANDMNNMFSMFLKMIGGLDNESGGSPSDDSPAVAGPSTISAEAQSSTNSSSAHPARSSMCVEDVD